MKFFGSLNSSGLGKILCYTFEIIALCVGVLGLVIAIYTSAVSASFIVFLQGLVTYAVYTVLIFGIGKIIDVLYYAHVVNIDKKTVIKELSNYNKDDED